MHKYSSDWEHLSGTQPDEFKIASKRDLELAADALRAALVALKSHTQVQTGYNGPHFTFSNESRLVRRLEALLSDIRKMANDEPVPEAFATTSEGGRRQIAEIVEMRRWVAAAILSIEHCENRGLASAYRRALSLVKLVPIEYTTTEKGKSPFASESTVDAWISELKENDGLSKQAAIHMVVHDVPKRQRTQAIIGYVKGKIM